MKKISYVLCVVAIALFSALFTTKTATATSPIPLIPTLLSDRDMKCLVDNVYHEARGESLDGMLAVAMVTLNRANHEKFPSTICGVVKQRTKTVCQFSWVCNRPKQSEKEIIGEVRKAAKIALYMHPVGYDLTEGALFYHADYVSPKWKKRLKKTVKVERHIFYRLKT